MFVSIQITNASGFYRSICHHKARRLVAPPVVLVVLLFGEQDPLATVPVVCKQTYMYADVELELTERPVTVAVVVVDELSPFPTEPLELKARVVFAARAHRIPPIT